MTDRVLGQKTDWTPLIILAVVVCGAYYLHTNQPKERHHSGGDQGVPSLRNGGEYTDNRKAKFNPLHEVHNPITGNSLSSPFVKRGGQWDQLTVFAVAVAIAVFVGIGDARRPGGEEL